MSETSNSPIATCVYRELGKVDSTTLRFSDHYLAYCASGTMRLEIESCYYFLQPTKAVWIPANTNVIGQIPAGITCCSILFNPEHFPKHHSKVQTIELTPLARHMILHCRRWSAKVSKTEHSAQPFYNALASIIVERMDFPTTDWVPRGSTKLVSRAVDLTLERYTESIEIGDIATALASSERTLSRRVVNETGMKWSDLLRRVRIIAARELLTSSEKKITNIAASVGYSSQSAFNRAFKVETGVAPSVFQKSTAR